MQRRVIGQSSMTSQLQFLNQAFLPFLGRHFAPISPSPLVTFAIKCDARVQNVTLYKKWASHPGVPSDGANSDIVSSI